MRAEAGRSQFLAFCKSEPAVAATNRAEPNGDDSSVQHVSHGDSRYRNTNAAFLIINCLYRKKPHALTLLSRCRCFFVLYARCARFLCARISR